MSPTKGRFSRKIILWAVNYGCPPSPSPHNQINRFLWRSMMFEVYRTNPTSMTRKDKIASRTYFNLFVSATNLIQNRVKMTVSSKPSGITVAGIPYRRNVLISIIHFICLFMADLKLLWYVRFVGSVSLTTYKKRVLLC